MTSQEHECKPIIHDGEYACGQCGKVDQELTEELYRELSVEQQRESANTNYYVANSAMIVELGSDHVYRSPQSKGLAFELGNPRARDFAHKRVKHTVVKDGYNVGLAIERNGYFNQDKDGKAKYKIDYTHDKWSIECKQTLFQLASEFGLEIHERVRAAKELKHLQSQVILGIMKDLLPLMSVCQATNEHGPNDKKRAQLTERLNSAREALRVAIVGDCAIPELEIVPELQVKHRR